MTLYHIAEQIEGSGIGQTIRESSWLFPAIEICHLLALATLGGSVLLISLSVFGTGLQLPAKQVLGYSKPYMTGAVITLIISGTLLGISETLKLLDREAFLVKMIALACSLLFTYLVFVPMVDKDKTGAAPKAVAGLTIALWLTVAMAGRWIGFS